MYLSFTCQCEHWPSVGRAEIDEHIGWYFILNILQDSEKHSYC